MFSFRPLSTVAFLILLHTAMMIVEAFCVASGAASWVEMLIYNSNAVAHGQLWRLLTYAFVTTPSIWFAFEMMMLYYFGRAVEKELGSKAFAFLYAGLILFGSLLLQLISIAGGTQQMSGSQGINFAIFAAFVAIYPDLPFFFAARARWVLLGFLALTALQLLEEHHFASIALFLSESLLALLFMQWRGYPGIFSNVTEHTTLDLLKRLMPLPPKKGTPKKNSTLLGSASISTSVLTQASKKAVTTQKKIISEKKKIDIDALLEKISETGIASLTEVEKKELEEARAALLKRDQRV